MIRSGGVNLAGFIGLISLIAGTTAFGYGHMDAKWSIRRVPYFVNPDNNDVPQEQALKAIQRAASAWSEQSHADFAFNFAGTSSGKRVGNNGKNEVFFRNATAPTGEMTMATTYSWWDEQGNFLDSDMVFWDGAYQFVTGNMGCNDGVYIDDVATHEFGHMLGLTHSDDEDSTMYATAVLCSKSSRTLNADDIAGVESLYPPALN